jgi:diadenylate cyclase
MFLQANDIWNFRIIDFIDIVLVAFLLYYVYKLIKGTVALNIFIGILIISLVWVLTDYLQMDLLHKIFDGFMKVGIIALIVVFQPEIRKFLLMIGSTNLRGRLYIRRFSFMKNEKKINTNTSTILDACKNMSYTKTGALIIIEKNNNLDFLINTGDTTNIEISVSLMESIFFKNSPLHDGAIIIENNTIKAVRVTLPLTNRTNLPKRYGLRHKAAVGITEKTDALAIVVSEETGLISYIRNGEFIIYNDLEDLKKTISDDLN